MQLLLWSEAPCLFASNFGVAAHGVCLHIVGCHIEDVETTMTYKSPYFKCFHDHPGANPRQ